MGKRKKKHPRAEPDAEADSKVPRSFVFKSGRVGKAVAHLVQDMRKVMLPYTAERLQVCTHLPLLVSKKACHSYHQHFVCFVSFDLPVADGRSRARIV